MLVLYDWKGFQKLFSIHGSHYSIYPTGLKTCLQATKKYYLSNIMLFPHYWKHRSLKITLKSQKEYHV